MASEPEPYHTAELLLLHRPHHLGTHFLKRDIIGSRTNGPAPHFTFQRNILSLPASFLSYPVTLSVYTLIFGSVPEGRIWAWEPSSIQSWSTLEAGIPSIPSL